MVRLTTADISDSADAQAILDGIRTRWLWLEHLFADGAYDRLKLMDKAAHLDFVIEVIRGSDEQKGFDVLPRRWVIERTFGWMTRWRRPVRDYEQRIDFSHANGLLPAHAKAQSCTASKSWRSAIAGMAEPSGSAIESCFGA